MRIAGMREDDDGTCLYLVEGEGPSGERLLLLYDENGGKARPAEPAGAEALFREGLLERCSFPAGSTHSSSVPQLSEPTLFVLPRMRSGGAIRTGSKSSPRFSSRYSPGFFPP